MNYLLNRWLLLWVKRVLYLPSCASAMSGLESCRGQMLAHGILILILYGLAAALSISARSLEVVFCGPAKSAVSDGHNEQQRESAAHPERKHRRRPARRCTVVPVHSLSTSPLTCVDTSGWARSVVTDATCVQRFSLKGGVCGTYRCKSGSRWFKGGNVLFSGF